MPPLVPSVLFLTLQPNSTVSVITIFKKNRSESPVSLLAREKTELFYLYCFFLLLKHIFKYQIVEKGPYTVKTL